MTRATPPQVKAKPRVNLADPRVKRTRKLLQATFVELLAEKSFDAITVQDIAERSTINRATFYSHFIDKYDLFGQFARDWFHTALEARLPLGAAYSRANLQLLVLVTMEALADMNEHCRPTEALKPLVMSAVQEEVSGVVLTWLRETFGSASPGQTSLETGTASLSWAIFGAALSWSQSEQRSPAEKTASEIAVLVCGGLATWMKAIAQ